MSVPRMKVYCYIIEHDWGFAPNPFWGVCTLATCKPQIRKSARIGDVIFGVTKKSVSYPRKIIYWMKVDKIMNIDEYYKDNKLKVKRANLRGSIMQCYGDNIYYTKDGEVRQIDSFHSNEDGTMNEKNIERDTGLTKNVLVANKYSYFGTQAIEIPEELDFLGDIHRGYKCHFSNDQVIEVKNWLKCNTAQGYIAEPLKWECYNLN